MASLNRVFLIGNLTRDPELRYTPSGTGLAKFGLAINEKYKDKETTVFVNVTAWGKTAELANEYLTKGSLCAIDGRLSFSSWDKDGEKRTALEVTAERVIFLDKKGATEKPQTEPPDSDPPPF